MPAEATQYQIVRMERAGYEDRNILAQGILTATSTVATTETPEEFHVSTQTIAVNGEYFFFNSPEININHNLSYSSGDELVVVGEIETTTVTEYASDAATITDLRVSQIIDWQSLALATTTIDALDNAEIIGPGENTYNLGGVNDVLTYNYTTADDFFKGTSMLCKHSGTAGWLPIWAGTTAPTRFLANYRRNNWNTQYGGNTYEARTRNVYGVTASPKLSGIATTTVYGGDTFITMFDNLNTVSKIIEITGSYQCETVYFPVESTINCELRHDDSIKRVWNHTRANMIQETAGTHVDGSALEYNQLTDLYQYNTVYSQENAVVFGIAKPEAAIYSLSDDYPNRVKYSDRKVDAEVSDSWVKFRTNNFIDLEKEYGPINNLEVYKNSLHFWHDRAFGVLAVNPRALLGTETGEGLVLGTGGFLDRADYVSKMIGNTNKYGIANSDNALYWIDNEMREMYQFTAGVRGSYSLSSALVPIASKYGMSSYLKGLGVIVDAQLVYDRRNSEIMITVAKGREATIGTLNGTDYVSIDNTNVDNNDFAIVKNRLFYIGARDTDELQLKDIDDFYTANETVYVAAEEDKRTFSFLEKANMYGLFYGNATTSNSISPGLYNDDFEYLISTPAFDDSTLWTHDKGNRGQLYGTYYLSRLYTTFNPEYPYTKVFDNLRWYTEVTDQSGIREGINQFSETWSTGIFYNDYQHSGDLTFGFRSSTLPFDRREREFTAAVPRNSVDVNVSSNPDIYIELDATQTYRGRMRDKYLIGRFDYTNDSSNYRFTCPYITMKYRSSIR